MFLDSEKIRQVITYSLWTRLMFKNSAITSIHIYLNSKIRFQFSEFFISKIFTINIELFVIETSPLCLLCPTIIINDLAQEENIIRYILVADDASQSEDHFVK